MEGAGREWDRKVVAKCVIARGYVMRRRKQTVRHQLMFPRDLPQNRLHSSSRQSSVHQSSRVTRQYASVVEFFDGAPVKRPWPTQIPADQDSLPCFLFTSERRSDFLFLNVCLSLKYGVAKLSFT